MGPSVRSQLVCLILRRVRACGGDVAALCRAYGLPDSAEQAPEVVLGLAELQSFFDAAARAAGDPFLGMHTAEQIPRGHWDILEYGSRVSPTVRDALARLSRFVALFNEHVVVSFEETRTEGVIAQHIPGHPMCLGRHGNEFFATAVLTQTRGVVAGPLIPTRVFFAHARPRDVSEHVRVFGTRALAFEADRNGFALPRAALSSPLSSYDPALLSLVERFADRALAEREEQARPVDFSTAARQAIRDQLRDAGPTLATTARALRMSSRTLQRRLEGAGVTFQELVQSVREELARTYLAAPDRPLGEIAFLLGYAELAPFVRAFRRWTGVTPAAYRARGAATPPGRRT